MDTNKSVGAVFERDPHTLTLSVTGNGTASADGGTISSGSGGSAPPMATINYVYGDVVNLTAAANSGWRFVRWDGALAPTTNVSETITIDADKSVEAIFEKVNYSLIWTTTGSGSVSPGSGITYVYDDGLTISATPDAGWEFVNWTGDIGNLVDAGSSSTTIKNPMAANTNVTANFAKTTYSLTYTVNGGGAVSPVSGSTYMYDDGLSITAVAAVGWEFVSWTGDTGNLVDPGIASTAIKNPMAANTNLTANFSKINYRLTWSVTGNGTVSQANGASYVYDQGLSVTANPATGWKFVSWTGDTDNLVNPGTASTALKNPLLADTNLTANFIKIDYSLTWSVTGSGSVIPASGTSYVYDQGLAIMATPVAGWEFKNWTGSGAANLVNANSASTSIKNPTADDTDLTANFALIEYNLNITIDEPFAGGGTTVTKSPDKATFHIGETVTLSATPGNGENFEGWSGDGTNTLETPPKRQIFFDGSGDKSVTASFVKQRFTVTFKSSNFGGIEVEGASPSYYEDEYTEYVDWGDNSKRVKAILDDQSQFKGWHGNYTPPHPDDLENLEIQLINVRQDMTVTYDTVPDINGCSTDVSSPDYSNGFVAADFKRVNVDVDSGTGHMVLNTGNQAIDPNNIVIPFTQDVYVTFLYEGAGFEQSDFGYKFASEGKGGTKHPIYFNVNDNNDDGVL